MSRYDAAQRAGFLWFWSEVARGERSLFGVASIRTVTSYARDMHHQLGELNVTRRVWGEGTRRTQRAVDFDRCARDREKWKAFIESATNEPWEPIPAGS